MKTIWLVCGNRGGVGKTLVALALTSCLMTVSRREVAVLDGDGRSPDVFAAATRKVPAKAVDFRRLRPDRFDDMTEADYESIVHGLLRISSDLVINTPDGADDVLLSWFDSTLRFAERSNCTFKLLYVLNNRASGLDIVESMAERFAFMFPIRNLHFARPEGFADFDSQFAENFRQIYDFPELRSNEVAQLLTQRFLPAEFVETPGGGMLSRQRVKDWLTVASNIFLDILNIDVANSCVKPLVYPPE